MLQAFYDADFVLDKVEVFEFGEVGQALYVFDLVEGEVEGGKFSEGVEAFDVRDEVVVEVDFCEGGGGGVGDGDGFYAVLTQAETLVMFSNGARGWREVAVPSSA